MMKKMMTRLELKNLAEIFEQDKNYGKEEYNLWRKFKKCLNEESSDLSLYLYENHVHIVPEDVTDCQWMFNSEFFKFLQDYYNPEMLDTKLTTTLNSIGTSADNYASTISDLVNSCYDTTIATDRTINTTLSFPNLDYYRYKDAWDVALDSERLDKIKDNLKKWNNRKENNKMKGFNFDFGPVKDIVHMSMYGMAIKNKNGVYVSYDKVNDTLMDVDILNFEGANKFMFKMPVPVKDIHAGDIIVHNGIPCFVKNTPDSEIKTFAVIDPYEGEYREIIIPKSMFGFDYATKVVNLLEGMFGNTTASAENPFGNMLPLMLLSDGAKSEDMLPLMLMNTSGTNMLSNPMMMYMMMKDRKDFDPLMLMAMSGMFNNTTHECHCHKEK